MAQAGTSQEQEIKNQKLYNACLEENEQLIKQLIDEKANPEYIVPCREGKFSDDPILFNLMYRKKYKAAKVIIQYGKANVNNVIEGFITTFRVAVTCADSIENRDKAIHMLLDNGFDVNALYDGENNSLHMLADYGMFDIINLLFSIGKITIRSINHQNDSGYTPLHELVKSDTIYVLEKHRAEKKTDSEFNYKVDDTIRTIKLFIQNGADILLRTNEGKYSKTALKMIREKSSSNIDYRIRFPSRTEDEIIEEAINYAVTNKSQSHLMNMLKEGVLKPYRYLAADKLEEVLDDIIIPANIDQIIDAFCRNKVNAAIKQAVLTKVLHCIINNGDVGKLSDIFGKKDSNNDPLLDINKTYDSSNNTLLHYAAKYGKENILRFLLSLNRKINKNPINKDGNTPLHIAAEGNHLNLRDILIQNGADASLQNNACQTYSDLLPALSESKNTISTSIIGSANTTNTKSTNADTNPKSSWLWKLITWLPNIFISLFTEIYHCFCSAKERKVQTSDRSPITSEHISGTDSESSSSETPSLQSRTPARGESSYIQATLLSQSQNSMSQERVVKDSFKSIKNVS